MIAPSRSPSTPAASPARTEPDERLLLAHTHGDRLRLRATLAYLNARVEPGLSASCYGGRPDATLRGTDRRAALVRFRSLVRDGGLPWVAKLDIASFFDAIPHGPLLAAIRGQMASRRCEREVAGCRGIAVNPEPAGKARCRTSALPPREGRIPAYGAIHKNLRWTTQ